MDKILLVLVIVLCAVMIQVYRNNKLNQQIFMKQKQLNEVNIKAGSSFINQRTLTLAISSLAIMFVLTTQGQSFSDIATGQEPMMNDLETEYAKSDQPEHQDRIAVDEQDSKDKAFCIFGAGESYQGNELSMISEGNNEVDYIFTVSSNTRGLSLIENFKVGIKLGVYVTEIKESYPMQGNAIEIAEECK